MKKRTVVIAVAATILGILLFVAVARATDSSGFCPSCHEMEPYYDSWAESPMGQNGVDCVDCHVDRGVVPRLLHKFVALREVYSHVTGDTKFPRAVTPVVPDERCTFCHTKIKQPAITGFNHTAHAKLKACQECHRTSGHRVTFDMLKAAGILDEENAKSSTAGTATANQIPGHVSVACTDCHNMRQRSCTQCHEIVHDDRVETPCNRCHTLPSDGWKAAVHAAETPCNYCHQAPADHYGDDCGTCHSPSSLFEDATGIPIHTGAVPCTKCHDKPAGHFVTDSACQDCHSAGMSWAFSHSRIPASGVPCTRCHGKPAGHRLTGNSCQVCHTAGTRWTFTHTRIVGSGTLCTMCHSKSAGHPPTGNTCQTCHTPGVNWLFSHDRVAGSGTACTVCHSKPAGHPPTGNTCQTCHATGVNWLFSHDRVAGSGASCTVCHSKSAGHPATSDQCQECHTSGVSWAFSHARIPGGEHTYRSFSCATCHPAGFGSYSCLSCHSDNNGGDD